MTKGKIALGISITVLGTILLVVSLFFPPLFFYAIPITAIGIAIIIMHESDSKIEQRKDLNKIKSKK